VAGSESALSQTKAWQGSIDNRRLLNRWLL